MHAHSHPAGLRLLALGTALALLASTAPAQSPIIWTNGSGSRVWNQTRNWTPELLPSGNHAQITDASPMSGAIGTMATESLLFDTRPASGETPHQFEISSLVFFFRAATESLRVRAGDLSLAGIAGGTVALTAPEISVISASALPRERAALRIANVDSGNVGSLTLGNGVHPAGLHVDNSIFAIAGAASLAGEASISRSRLAFGSLSLGSVTSLSVNNSFLDAGAITLAPGAAIRGNAAIRHWSHTPLPVTPEGNLELAGSLEVGAGNPLHLYSAGPAVAGTALNVWSDQFPSSLNRLGTIHAPNGLRVPAGHSLSGDGIVFGRVIDETNGAGISGGGNWWDINWNLSTGGGHSALLGLAYLRGGLTLGGGTLQKLGPPAVISGPGLVGHGVLEGPVVISSSGASTTIIQLTGDLSFRHKPDDRPQLGPIRPIDTGAYTLTFEHGARPNPSENGTLVINLAGGRAIAERGTISGGFLGTQLRGHGVLQEDVSGTLVFLTPEVQPAAPLTLDDNLAVGGQIAHLVSNAPVNLGPLTTLAGGILVSDSGLVLAGGDRIAGHGLVHGAVSDTTGGAGGLVASGTFDGGVKTYEIRNAPVRVLSEGVATLTFTDPARTTPLTLHAPNGIRLTRDHRFQSSAHPMTIHGNLEWAGGPLTGALTVAGDFKGQHLVTPGAVSVSGTFTGSGLFDGGLNAAAIVGAPLTMPAHFTQGAAITRLVASSLTTAGQTLTLTGGTFTADNGIRFNQGSVLGGRGILRGYAAGGLGSIENLTGDLTVDARGAGAGVAFEWITGFGANLSAYTGALTILADEGVTSNYLDVAPGSTFTTSHGLTSGWVIVGFGSTTSTPTTLRGSIVAGTFNQYSMGDYDTLKADNGFTVGQALVRGEAVFGHAGGVFEAHDRIGTTGGITVVTGAGFGIGRTSASIVGDLRNDGAVGGEPLVIAGVIGGRGTFNSDVTLQASGEMSDRNGVPVVSVPSGGLNPGRGGQPGLLTFARNLTLAANSTSTFELAGAARGSGYDAINVAGTFSLAGNLRVVLGGGFTPAAGQSFQLFQAAGVSGTFATVTLPPLGGGLSWDVSTLYTSGTIRIGGVATVALSELEKTYNGMPQGATITTIPADLAVAVTYNGSATVPANAGTYTVVVTVTHPAFTGSATGTLTIAKAPATVTFAGLEQTYDGTPRSVTATTTPAGLPVTVSYDGNAGAPTHAGSYAIAATIDDPNHTGSATGTLVVAKAAQTIAFPNPGPKTFGDPAFALNATASSGLPVAYHVVSGPATINGATVTLTGSGTVVLSASQAGDANRLAAPDVEVNFTVAPIAATIVLGGLSATYDGTPHAATATTTPAGLTVGIRYNGSPTAPTNAGSYSVLARIEEPNYSGSAAGTLIIAQAPQTIAFNPVPGVTYGDQPFEVNATATSGLPVAFSIVSGPATISGRMVTISGAGTVVVRAAQPGDTNHAAAVPVDQSFTVGKANQSIAFGSLSGITFGDAPIALNATASSGLPVTFALVSGPATLAGNNLTITSAGPVVVRASQAGDANHNPAPDVEQTLTVGKANQSITFAALPDRTYGDPAFTVTATASSGLPVTFSVANGPATVTGQTVTLTGAGTVILRAAQAGDANHNPAPNVDRTFNVAQAILAAKAQDTTRTYGTANPEFAITYTGFVNGDNAASLATPPVASTPATAASPTGAHPITVGGGADPRYRFTYASGTLTITPATATIALGNLSATYDGAPHAASVTTNPAGLAVTVTYDGSTTVPVNAGSYAVAATIADTNYTGSGTGTLAISRAPQTITFPNPGNRTLGGGSFLLGATASSGLPVTYAIVSGPATVAGSAVTLTGAGTVTIRAMQPGSLNYLEAAPVEVSFTVSAPTTPATIVLAGLRQAYDGTPKSVTATTTPAGLPVTLTYGGSPVAPVLPGRYPVVASVATPEHTATATATLEITVTALLVHAPALNADVDGSVQVLLPESVTLNSNAGISGDLLLPGTPSVRLNGRPTFVGVRDGGGAASPADHTVTLNGGALLRYLVHRTNPILMPIVARPAAPAGSRNVTINRAGDSPGDFATLRNLTLNSNAGAVAVPAGAYGTFTASGNSRFVLGVAGATAPAVYQLQGLTLNGHGTLQIAGPVELTVGGNVTLDTSIVPTTPSGRLTLRVSGGGVTLNGNATLQAEVIAPNGTVTLNGNSRLRGRVTASRLTLNGNSVLEESP